MHLKSLLLHSSNPRYITTSIHHIYCYHGDHCISWSITTLYFLVLLSLMVNHYIIFLVFFYCS
jgi:hypothetical protein